MHGQWVRKGVTARQAEVGQRQRHFGVQLHLQLVGRQVHAVRRDGSDSVKASGLAQMELQARVALRSSLFGGLACGSKASLDADSEAHKRRRLARGVGVVRVELQDSTWGHDAFEV